MTFRAVFIAIVIATAMIVSAYLINSPRPRTVVEQPSPAFVRASGKCAECHLSSQYSVVHEFEMSAHARKSVNCLDCHQVAAGQKGKDHHGFVINSGPTPANCRSCHEAIYTQFLRPAEWIPVISSGLAVGFLVVPLALTVNRTYLLACALAMLGQAIVGIAGFVLHFRADWQGIGPTLFDRVVYGAPVFAPMLFPDLVVLAFIGLWVLGRHQAEVAQTSQP